MAEETVGETVRAISDDVKGLVQAEVELAKSELVPAAKHAGIGGGLLAGAGYFGHHALGLGLVTVALGIYAAGLSLWLSFLIVTVAVLLLAAVLGLVGFLQVKKVKGPQETIKQAKTSIADVQAAVKRGLAAAKAPQIEGRVVSSRDAVARAEETAARSGSHSLDRADDGAETGRRAAGSTSISG